MVHTIDLNTLYRKNGIRVTSIEAGGPGSGRRPGYGSGKTANEIPESQRNNMSVHQRQRWQQEKAEKAHVYSDGYCENCGQKWSVQGKNTECKPTALAAGGPGSGRKPEWLSDNTKRLNDYHKSLTNQGYKYKSSALRDPGSGSRGLVAFHKYTKSNSDGSVSVAHIHEPQFGTPSTSKIG